MISKLFCIGVAAIAGLAAALPAQAEGSGTTRIETRPFYGATVTIEAGVRVFRPLPTTKRVIINPDGETPVSLGFNETNVYERSYNYHDHQHNDRYPAISRGSFFPGSNIGHVGVGR